MNEDFTVRTEYYNKAMDAREIRTYPFESYTDHIYNELKSLVRDVESVLSYLQNYKDKDNWDPEALEDFQTIRKKLLNNANNIGRLPQTLCYKGVPCANVSMSEIIAKIINDQ